MISSLEVGSTFRIVDEASPTLAKIADSLKLLQGEIDKVKESFSTLASSSFSSLATRLDEVTKQVAGVGDAGARAAEKMAGAFDTAVGAMSSGLARLEQQIAGMKVEAAVVGGSGLAGLRARTTAAAGGGDGMRLTGPELRAGGFGVAGGMFGGPIGIIAAGGAIGSYESLKTAAQFQTLKEMMKIGGVSQSEIDKASEEAMTLGPSFGMTPSEFMRSINETRNILNKGTSPDEGVEGALAHAKTMAMASLVLKSQGGKGGEAVGRDLYDLVKSAEFRNAISDKDFDAAISSMVQSDIATGGIVNPRTWLQMSQYLKGALPGLSNDFLYSYMPELAQEFKGSGAGTSMASLYQQLVAGQMRTSGLRLLDQIGMVDESKVDFDKNGRIVKARPGYFKDDETFKANPLQGMEDIVKAMQSHGISDEKEQRDYITMLFGNRNAAQMALTLAYQDMRLNRGAQGIKGTWDLSKSADELLKNDPMTQFRKTWADLEAVMVKLGERELPNVVAGLQGLDTILEHISKFLGEWHDPVTGKPYELKPTTLSDIFGAPLDSGNHDLDKLWNSFKSQFKPGDLSNVPDLGLVPDAKGGGSWLPIPSSWFRRSSYGDDGVWRGDMGGDVASAQTVDILAQTVNLANMGGGGGFGGGVIPASYETGGGLTGGSGGLHSGGGYTVLGGSGGGSGGGLGGLGAADLDQMAAQGNFPDSPAGRAAFIRSNAIKMGLDPDYVLSVAKSEGLFGVGPLHQNAQGYNVFGDFQLNYSRGVGVAARNAGIEPSDWKRSDLFAMNWMKAHGMNDWAASGHHGPVPLYHGSPIRSYVDRAPLGVASDYPESDFSHRSHTVHAAAMNVASAGDAGIPAEIHVHSYLDGKQVATSTVRHIVKRNRQVFGASKHDGMGHLTPVDAGYQFER